MKNLKSIMILLLFAAFAFPDIVQAQTPVHTYTLACITNTGVVKARDTADAADTIILKPICNAGRSDSGAIMHYGDITYSWAFVASLSATTTASVTCWGSNTGTYSRTMGVAANSDWVQLTSSTTQYNGSSTIVPAATGTTYGHFIFPNCQFKYVWIRVVTSGAGQTSTITGKMYSRPHG